MPDSLADVVFAIPGDIDAPTGGYAYDRRLLLALLPSYGVDVRHVALPAGYPSPSAADLAETGTAAARNRAGYATDHRRAGVRRHAGRSRGADRAAHHCSGASPAGTGDRTVGRAPRRTCTEKAALAFARHVVVTSPATRRALVADYGVDAGIVTVAEPGHRSGAARHRHRRTDAIAVGRRGLAAQGL